MPIIIPAYPRPTGRWTTVPPGRWDGDPDPPAQVTGLQVTGKTATSVSLSWSSVEGADTYSIYVDGVLNESGITGTTGTATGLTAETTYNTPGFQVSAVNEGGEGDLSSAVIETTNEAEDLPSPTLVHDDFSTENMTPILDNANFSWLSNNRTSLIRIEGDDGRRVWHNGSQDDFFENAVPELGWGAKSGDNSLRFRWPPDTAQSEQRWTMGNAYKEIWARWWLKVPINFEKGSGSNNKIFAFWMDDYSASGDGSTCFANYRSGSPSGSATWTWSFSQGRNTVGGAETTIGQFITVPDDRLKWMQLVVRLMAETSEDADDGIMEIWRRWEGDSSFTKEMSEDNLRIRVPDSGPQGFAAGYLMGWANDTFNETTEFFIDDFELSDQPLVPAEDL